MALTVCFECDRTYPELNSACPHCGCRNFFADPATVLKAVSYLCDELEDERRKKLQELEAAQWWRSPPRWMRFILWFDPPSGLIRALQFIGLVPHDAQQLYIKHRGLE